MSKAKSFIDCYVDMVYYFATRCPAESQYREAIKRLNRIVKEKTNGTYDIVPEKK